MVEMTVEAREMNLQTSQRVVILKANEARALFIHLDSHL